MRAGKSQDFICTVVMMIFVGVLLFVAFGYPKEVRLVPFVVGFPTLILLLILLIGEFYPKMTDVVEEAMEDLWGGGSGGKFKKGKTSEFTEWRPVLSIMSWVVLFYVFVLLFGLVLVSPLFIAGFLIRRAGLPWMKAISYALVATIIIYMGLTVLLKVDLWRGAIPTIIPGILGGSILPPI